MCIKQEQTESTEEGVSSISMLSPSKKKRRAQLLLVTGLILLIIGLIIAFLVTHVLITKKSVEDMENDYDISNYTYRSYDVGDKIIITGKVTKIIELKYLLLEDENNENIRDAKYLLILDKKTQLYATGNEARIGDVITVECEVEEMNVGVEARHVLKAKTFYNIPMLTIISLSLLIISSILIGIGIKKRKESRSKTAASAYKLARMYESFQSKDDDTALYQFLKSKEKEQVDSQKHPIDFQTKGSSGITQTSPTQNPTKPPLAQPAYSQSFPTVKEIQNSTGNKIKPMQPKQGSIPQPKIASANPESAQGLLLTVTPEELTKSYAKRIQIPKQNNK